jgi:hypothetical protein
MLGWYRDTKREFVLWQIGNFKRHLAKYNLGATKLLLYVPGRDYAAEDWREAVRTGSGGRSIRLMCDSGFLLETAGKEGCWLQYTASENADEVAHLRQYMKDHGLDAIPMWGENAGVPGAAKHPGHLADVIVDQGLYGLDYTHSVYLFDEDGITPNELLEDLGKAYSRIQGR